MRVTMTQEAAKFLRDAGYDVLEVGLITYPNIYDTSLDIASGETKVINNRTFYRDSSGFLGRIPNTSDIPSLPSRTAFERGLVTIRDENVVMAIKKAGFTIEQVGHCKYAVGPVLVVAKGGVRHLNRDQYIENIGSDIVPEYVMKTAK